MSKSTKIVVSLLVVAGFVCLAIGTIFACDYISQSNNSVALDKKQVIVASAERFSLPNVRFDEPMLDFVVPDSWVGTWYFNFDVLSSSTIPNGYWKLSELDDVDGISILIDSQVHYFAYLGVYSEDGVVVVDVEDSSGYNLLEFTSSFYFEILDPSLSFCFSLGSVSECLASLPFPEGFLTRVPGIPSFGEVITGELLGILVSGLTGIGQGLGESLSPIATAIFVNTAGDGLSVFGILIAVFAAISLGLSFTRFVLNFVTSWGNRNR